MPAAGPAPWKAKSTWTSGLRDQLALRPQLLDQHLEGQVLMGEGAQRRVAHPREQAAEGRIAGQPARASPAC